MVDIGKWNCAAVERYVCPLRTALAEHCSLEFSEDCFDRLVIFMTTSAGVKVPRLKCLDVAPCVFQDNMVILCCVLYGCQAEFGRDV